MHEIEFMPETTNDLKALRKFGQRTIVTCIETQLRDEPELIKLKKVVHNYLHQHN